MDFEKDFILVVLFIINYIFISINNSFNKLNKPNSLHLPNSHFFYLFICHNFIYFDTQQRKNILFLIEQMKYFNTSIKISSTQPR